MRTLTLVSFRPPRRRKVQSQLKVLSPTSGQCESRSASCCCTTPGTPVALALQAATRGALAQFLVDHGIQVILTGHIHTPCLQMFSHNQVRNTRYLSAVAGPRRRQTKCHTRGEPSVALSPSVAGLRTRSSFIACAQNGARFGMWICSFGRELVGSAQQVNSR